MKQFYRQQVAVVRGANQTIWNIKEIEVVSQKIVKIVNANF